jgi:hypothetical protein
MLPDVFISYIWKGERMHTKLISCVICGLMIATFIMIEIPKNASAEVKEEWAVRYDGKAKYDLVHDIAVDQAGNVYVTGTSYKQGEYGDLITISYDSFGNMRWLKKYDSPNNETDNGWAITVDSLDFIYVTGYCNGTVDSDFVTIKYDSYGNELWVATYDGIGGFTDRGMAIIVDQLGNVMVTGISYGTFESGSGTDFTTIKYDSDGNQLWVSRYNGPGNAHDHALSIACDSKGNVYVTGDSRGNGTWEDFTTVAYDSFGNELWVSNINGPPSSYDYGNDIAVDALGYIYVTGSVYYNDTDYDFFTMKYDSKGTIIWTVRYNGPGNKGDVAWAMTLDPFGNIYVIGNSLGKDGTEDKYAIVAYDSNGNELWVTRCNVLDTPSFNPYAIISDFEGNIYVTGSTPHNNTNLNIATIAYDRNGNEKWIIKYDGTGHAYDFPYAITVDQYKNVYVTGWSWGGREEGYDFATIKYSQQEPILQVTIDIDPNTLNLKSKGRWITCYITLNEPYDPNDIDISTILLEDTIPAEWGDIQGDRLMLKFDRSDVQALLPVGTYNLKVTGELTDGTSFEGYSDEIRVINPGK